MECIDEISSTNNPEKIISDNGERSENVLIKNPIKKICGQLKEVRFVNRDWLKVIFLLLIKTIAWKGDGPSYPRAYAFC